MFRRRAEKYTESNYDITILGMKPMTGSIATVEVILQHSQGLPCSAVLTQSNDFVNVVMPNVTEDLHAYDKH
jgi:hypothetical protein